MSPQKGSAGQGRTAWHEFLLRLAGRVPDGRLTEARGLLAEDRTDELARAIAPVLLEHEIPLLRVDRDLLRDRFTEIGGDARQLDGLPTQDAEARLSCAFSAQRIDRESWSDESWVGAADAAAVEGVALERGALGLWRSWRYRNVDGSWVEPRRVYAVELRSAELPGVAARLAERLSDAGETDPQVEVFAIGQELPQYQRAVCGAAALLWAEAPEAPINVARIFDEVHPDHGPRFTGEHPLVDDEGQRQALLSYLRSGEVLLFSTVRYDDVVDPARRQTVPASFRTDGTWIWTDHVTYYLEQHRLQPDPVLVGHIQDNDFKIPELSEVTLFRALAHLRRPSRWRVGV